MVKYRNLIIVGILLSVAFVMRFHAAKSIFFVEDEIEHIKAASNICFDLHKLRLPVGSKKVGNPLLATYFVRFASIIFGSDKIALRLPFVFLGTLSLLFVYKLTSEYLDRERGLLVLTILTFCQYHICFSRFISEVCVLLFFSILTLYFLLKTIYTGQKKWIYLIGAVMGVGFYGHPLLLLLAPCFIIFLMLYKVNNRWFIMKEMCKALLLTLILISPYLFWCYQNGFDKWINEHLLEIGFSFRTFNLYFGETIAWLSEIFPDIFFYGHIPAKRGGFANIDGKLKIIIDGSNEYPVVNWLLGILIIISFFYCLRKIDKREYLVVFSLVMFAFIFVITSIISGGYSFDDHWWATMSLYPGVILFSTMAIDFKKKYYYARYLIYILILYFILNALYIINMKESIFAMPKKVACNYYLERDRKLLADKKMDEATYRCDWILNHCSSAELINKTKGIIPCANLENSH